MNENQIESIIDNERNLKEMFTEKTYKNEFETYYERNKPLFDKYCVLYKDTEDSALYVRNMAVQIVDRERRKLENIKSRQKKGKCMMNDSSFTALFAIPALIEYNHEETDLLADEIVIEWHKYFPDNQIQKTTFDEIQNGFRKHKFCFITTAVCRSMDKPDDCPELMTLRSYRDTWLQNQPDGKKLIETYYQIAPAILAKINTRWDAEQIYKDLYQKDICQCLEDIEHREFEACKEHYMAMVYRLEDGKF